MAATYVLPTTTLSAAIAPEDVNFAVASVANIVPGVWLVSTSEAMQVSTVDRNALPYPRVTVQRGVGGSVGASQASGATVYIGTPDKFYQRNPVGVPPAPALVTPYINTSLLDGGVSFWNPNSGNTAWVQDVASQTCATITASGGITSSSPTAGIGYATGAGGAVTQLTDKSTAVTKNTITTAITLNNASLAANTSVSFTFTNSAIAATDTVLVTHQSAGTSGSYNLNAFPGSGSAVITVRNITAGSLAEAIVLRVTVIKSVSA